MDSDFLPALLHDLQGPVSRVHMLGELVVRRLPDADPELRLLLGHLETSVSEAQAVLNALRRYAERTETVFQPRRLDLTLAASAAVECVAEQLKASGGAVHYGVLPEVCGDFSQLATLFQELIANSIAFRSAEPPRIEIAAEPDDASGWWISFTDNGKGLGDRDPERIFRPFVKTPGRKQPGVGLAICRRIARRHGGDLIAVGSRATGLELRLHLPQ